MAQKNQAAFALGREGGLKGGLARARSLSPERRREIASNAAEVRWQRRLDERRMAVLVAIASSVTMRNMGPRQGEVVGVTNLSLDAVAGTVARLMAKRLVCSDPATRRLGLTPRGWAWLRAFGYLEPGVAGVRTY